MACTVCTLTIFYSGIAMICVDGLALVEVACCFVGVGNCFNVSFEYIACKVNLICFIISYDTCKLWFYRSVYVGYGIV